MTAAGVFDVMGTLFELAPLRERLQAIGASGASLERGSFFRAYEREALPRLRDL